MWTVALVKRFKGFEQYGAFGGEHREDSEYTVGHHTITRMRMFCSPPRDNRLEHMGFYHCIKHRRRYVGRRVLVCSWRGDYCDIGAFQVYVLYLLNPVWQIVESITELQRSLAAMERVFDVLESPIDKPDDPDAVEFNEPIEEIRFENVSFAYNEGTDVIRNFELSVKGGSVIALVGRSGAGKTTITDLVARFYDPTSGRILLNGKDLRKIKLSDYRETLGVVQQEVFLLMELF